MERATPVRKPNTSAADLLTWSEVPPANNSASASGNASRSGARSHQVNYIVTCVVCFYDLLEFNLYAIIL